ncbi:MAG: hypothetical protein HKN80_05015 [Acidimicrobiia bacterium]|nr:hypothetical protein [Acidimicrobiia bacterium]
MHTTKRRSIAVALLVLAAGLSVAPASATANPAPTRILLVGDSITSGHEGDTAYRCDLWSLLTAEHAVDFIGNQSPEGSCGTAGFDWNHEGRGGATTAERIDEMTIGGSFNLGFDAALVHLGTNDKNGVNSAWTQSYMTNTLEPVYRSLVAKLRQNNPTVTIYLPQLIPCTTPPIPADGFLGCDVTHDGGLDNNGQPVEGMNDVWARIAADSSTPQSPIILVDHRNVTTGDLKADGVHPNASGRAKMAANWANALQSQLDANSVADQVVLVEPNGRWHLRIEGQADRTFWYGAPGDVPLFGDWDGDGLATPGAWRQGAGGGFAYLTNALPANGAVGVAQFDFFFGIPGDQVFVGDWNGDNRDTLGLNRGGRIFLTDTNGSGGEAVPTNYDFFFGVAGDRAFGGDADGDGDDGIFLYRETTGLVYYTNETPATGVASTADTFFFGSASDQFIAGDWDEDGVDSAGIYRSSNTNVYLSNTNASGGAPAPTDLSYGWGSAGWLPVSGRWR